MTSNHHFDNRAHPVVCLHDVSYNLPSDGREIIHDVNLTVNQGEIHIIKGPSGSGKTTLLQLCGSILYPTKGQAQIFNVISTPKTAASIRSRIGFVFQTPVLFEDLTVLESFEVMALWRQLDPKTLVARGKQLLELFQLGDYLNQKPKRMSGGERQRISLIMALITNPSLLLLDEPLGSVDFKTQEVIIKHLQTIIEKEKMTMVAVTHGTGLDDIGTHFHSLIDGKLD